MTSKEHPDVIRRGRSFVLARGEGGTGIPYSPVGPREDGTQNYGYKPLGQNVDLIDEIPELAGHPAFKSLVKFINVSSVFETYACDTRSAPYDHANTESSPKWEMSSFFNMGLKDHSANTLENILEIAGDLCALLDRREIPWVQFEVLVEPGRYGGRNGYMILVRTIGYGVNESHAYRFWAAAHAWFLAVLIELMQGWPSRPSLDG